MKLIEVYGILNLPKLNNLEEEYLFIVNVREIPLIKKIIEHLIISYNNLNWSILIPKKYLKDEKNIILYFEYLDFSYQKYCLFKKGKCKKKEELFLFYDYYINYVSNTVFTYENILDLVIPIINIINKLFKKSIEIENINILSIGTKGSLNNKIINYIKFNIENIIFKIGFNIKNNNKKIRLITNFYKKSVDKSYLSSLLELTHFSKKEDNEDIDLIDINDEIFNNINYNDYNSVEQKCVSVFKKCNNLSKYYDKIIMDDNIITIELLLDILYENEDINENIKLSIFDNYIEYKKQIYNYINFNEKIGDTNKDCYFNYDNIC